MALIPIGFGGGGADGSDDVTATKRQVLSGYTAITRDSNDEPIAGTMPRKPAATYNPSTEAQTIAAGVYLDGSQTIRPVTTQNIDAANIKKGVVVKVGDSNNDGRIKNVTGEYTTVTQKRAATASQILSGFAAYANGSSQINGTIETKDEEVYNTSTVDREIAAGLYTGGKQTIKAVKTANIEAENIKAGVEVQVGDENEPTRIKGMTGTYSTVSGKSAIVAGAVRNGYAGFANGSEQINGTIVDQAGGTYTPGTSNQTIANAGRYLTSNVVMKGDANLVAGNILSGKSIFGVAGNVRKYGWISENLTSSSSTVSYNSTYNDRTNTVALNYISKNPGFTPLLFTAVGSWTSGGDPCHAGRDAWGFFVAWRTGVLSGDIHWPKGGNTSFTASNITAPVKGASRSYAVRIAGYY